MIHNFAYILITGKPLIMYMGLLTFFLLSSTALVGFLKYKGVHAIPFKWHPVLASATIVSAIIHGLMGLSIYFNF